MLTRARARATNQHVFVDDKWNDAYIQTKDEQIDMLHAQRVLKSWEDDADSEAEEAAAAAVDGEEEGEEDEDRWISEESGDEEEEDDDEQDAAAKDEALKQQQRRRRRAGNVLAGGGFVENVLWTAMAATVAPVALYSVAARVGIVGRKRRWPLQSASLGGTLVKAYLNVATIAVLLGAAVWGVCGDVLLPLALPFLRWRSLLRLARRVDSCAVGFVEDWQDVVSGGGGAAQLPLLLLNRETQRLVAHAALLLSVAVLLTQFYRLWLKAVVLLTTMGVLGARVASHLRAEQRSAIEIVALDPNFAFANESIFIAIDGQNLEQGATVAWVPYWGVLQHLQAAECDKLFAQPLRNGGVRVAFDQLNEFVPCYAARGDDDDFKCFEHLRLRVKDQKSVPGWSLHALPAAAARPSDEL